MPLQRPLKDTDLCSLTVRASVATVLENYLSHHPDKKALDFIEEALLSHLTLSRIIDRIPGQQIPEHIQQALNSGDGTYKP